MIDSKLIDLLASQDYEAVMLGVEMLNTSDQTYFHQVMSNLDYELNNPLRYTKKESKALTVLRMVETFKGISDRNREFYQKALELWIKNG